ncbi:MAG: FG-GAP-like repeat-containing protein, partial [Candidatus Azobacteroides sp.]|nr:FG-GAP-like repeat-containing protein [Candidatus Azobacteroides sp.]
MDELGSNHWSEVTVEIVTAPQHASSVSVEGAMKLISYTPQPGFWGRDSLEYSVFAPDENATKTAWVYINVTNQPDNLSTDKCTSPPPSQIWGMEPTRTNEVNLSPYQNALVGDLDGDGTVEIVVSTDPINDGSIVGRPAYGFAIYKGTDISVPFKTFQTVQPYDWTLNTRYGIVKTQLANKDSALIVVAEADRYLRAYNYNGGLVWTSDAVYHSTSCQFASPTFYDLNQDGIPEVIVHGKIFDSRTGELLCSLPDEMPNGRNMSMAIVADLYGTGEMYLIVGNYIYKPDTDLRNGLILDKKIDPSGLNAPAGIVPGDWGRASLVDIDNDGRLDLIISVISGTYTFIYIADPQTGNIKASTYASNAAASSYPFIGDIDGDGYPEIVFIEYQSIIAYKYNRVLSVLEEFWKLPHEDTSGATGITLFDFNQDGISELIYRDEKNLRIINGSKIHHQTLLPCEPYDLATYENISSTGSEYPTIADVDGDGQAEILIVGGHSAVAGTTGMLGCLWVFKSADPDNSPWASARKVWNQYAFNPVNINEDLTV